MKIYNSLTKTEEEFVPFESREFVGVYTCGPTVYFYPHIGNWRTFTFGDLVVRTLKYLGYRVHYVMNITDVGHLTGDNAGDADTGEDRLEKAAKKESKTAWDIANFYTKDFIESYKKLGLTMPTQDNAREGFSVATDYIAEQIEIIKRIEAKGYAYKISDGVYFDIAKYESDGNIYGRMSNIHKDNLLSRVEPNLEKKDQRDFALWKFSYEGGRNFDATVDKENDRRSMEWKSPWGLGFPGWHIECSAISSKFLGEQFEIHIGGEDHKSTHHPGEIAQSEAAFGKKPFVKYWLHGAFLTVDGGRMGKSLGNAYTLHDVEEKGYDAISLRYFYLMGHYRKKLNFTWEALSSAQKGLNNLKQLVLAAKKQTGRSTLSEEKRLKMQAFSEKFRDAISDDFNMPQALAILWEVLKSNIPSEDKYDLAISFDEVLGLELGKVEQLEKVATKEEELSDELKELIKEREKMRKVKNFAEADKIRDELDQMGYTISDKSLKD